VATNDSRQIRRRRRREEVEPDPPIFQHFSLRRVNLCAASGGGAWRRRAATVPAVPEASQNPSQQFLEF